MSKEKLVCVSGGFDPVHIGHLRMIEEAAKYGHVVVIVNSDKWLMRKKGYIFMPWSERAEILSAFKGVVAVIQGKDDDDSVCESIADLKNTMDIDYFGNGGDRKNNNTPEVSLCEQLGIDMVWNVGGGKIQSSSDLVAKSKENR